MSNERRVDIICGFGHFACHFFMLAFPALCLWIRKDLALNDADTLNIGFYMYLLFGLIALPVLSEDGLVDGDVAMGALAL